MGIVHHANYARWFEEARLHYMSQVGLDYGDMEQWGLLSPVLFCNCEYKRAVRFPEVFTIDVRMKDFSGVRFSVEYSVYTGEERTLVAKGESGHCFANASMHPIRLKTQYPELYQRMQALMPRGEEDTGAEEEE